MDLSAWLDSEVYPRLSHEAVFGSLDGFRAVGRGYLARCPNPAHEDRHPSFWMPDGRTWGKCFACGYFVTWWKYLEESRGLHGREMIVELARLAGVPPLPPSGGDGGPEAAVEAARRREEEAARDAAVEAWWEKARQALWNQNDPAASVALAYLWKRGYSDDVIRAADFGVRPPGVPAPEGIALPPPSHPLLLAARGQGGRIVGFAGRYLGPPADEKEAGKYRYSEGFPRGEHVWGTYRVSRRDTPVLVEGVIDALVLGGAHGLPVVALGGAQLSPGQVAALRGWKRVVLALDADEAGRAGTAKAVHALAAAGVKAYVVADFAGAKDPDEMVRARGVDAFREAVRRAVAGHKWLVRQLALPPGAGDQERDAAVAAAMDYAESLARRDPVAAAEVAAEAAAAMGVSEAAFREAVDRLAAARRREEAKKLWLGGLARAKEALDAGDFEAASEAVEEGRKAAARALRAPVPHADASGLEAALAGMSEGLTFPWPALTSLARVDAGGLTVVGAGTSHGKSTFVYNLILHFLENYDGSVVLWSGEVVNSIVWARLVSILAGADFQQTLRGYREGLYTPGAMRAREKLASWADRLYLLDEPTTAQDLAVVCARIAEQGPVTAIFVDYLQQLPPDGEIHRTREEEVSLTCSTLRATAKSLAVPVVAAVQLNRSNARYAEKPDLSHFRESGRIEQEAQLALGLWNSRMAAAEEPDAAQKGNGCGIMPEAWYWKDDETATRSAVARAVAVEKTLVEVSILKSRLRGGVGKAVPLMLDGATGRIEALPSGGQAAVYEDPMASEPVRRITSISRKRGR